MGKLKFHRHRNLVSGSGASTELTRAVNNPSASIPGLGTGSLVTAKSAYSAPAAQISYGGGMGTLAHNMSKLNFNIKKGEKNIKLKP